MIEVLKQALGALERSVATCFDQYAHRTVMSQPDHFINHAITSLRQAIAEAEKQDGDCQRCGGKGCVACDAREQEPVAWATREDFYRELDRSVNRMRQQMEIKAVLMRCKNYDLALPIIDIREGHVLVGQVTQPKREWVGLTDEEISAVDWKSNETLHDFARSIEAKLKEKNSD